MNYMNIREGKKLLEETLLGDRDTPAGSAERKQGECFGFK